MNSEIVLEILRANMWVVVSYKGYHWYLKHKGKPGIVMFQRPVGNLFNLHIRIIEDVSGVALCHGPNGTRSLSDNPTDTADKTEVIPMHNNLYCALFHPAKEKAGGYVVTFPDLPGCVTQGVSYAEACYMAVEALNGYLDVLERNGGKSISTPAHYLDVRKRLEAKAQAKGETFDPDRLALIPAR